MEATPKFNRDTPTGGQPNNQPAEVELTVPRLYLVDAAPEQSNDDETLRDSVFKGLSEEQILNLMEDVRNMMGGYTGLSDLENLVILMRKIGRASCRER